MQWTYDTICNERTLVLALTKDEVKLIADIVLQSKILKKLEKQAEKYQDKHDCGEATDKDEDKLMYINDKIDIIEKLIAYDHKH